MLSKHPSIIRIAQLAANLHDHAENASLALDDPEHDAGATRLALAHAIVMTQADADPLALTDPTSGVAYTQRMLQGIQDLGYTTALSQSAFAERALDIALDEGTITEQEFRSYQLSEADPTDLIEALIAQRDVVRIELPDETPYFVTTAGK